MSASVAFLILGGAQAIIYLVIRRLVQQAVVDEPPRLLRFIVALTGIIAVALLLASAYLAFSEV